MGLQAVAARDAAQDFVEHPAFTGLDQVEQVAPDQLPLGKSGERLDRASGEAHLLRAVEFEQDIGAAEGERDKPLAIAPQLFQLGVGRSSGGGRIWQVRLPANDGRENPAKNERAPGTTIPVGPTLSPYD